MDNAPMTSISGDREENMQKAIEYCQKALKVYAATPSSSGYAELQLKLGKTYAALPGGWHAEKRSVHLRRAIDCYKAVLTVYTRESAPVDYAQTHVELGNIYMQLKDGDEEENLQAAIACYKEALHCWLKDIPSVGSPYPLIAQEKMTSACLDLAHLYIKQGRIERIQGLYQEIRQLYADEAL